MDLLGYGSGSESDSTAAPPTSSSLLHGIIYSDSDSDSDPETTAPLAKKRRASSSSAHPLPLPPPSTAPAHHQLLNPSSTSNLKTPLTFILPAPSTSPPSDSLALTLTSHTSSDSSVTSYISASRNLSNPSYIDNLFPPPSLLPMIEPTLLAKFTKADNILELEKQQQERQDTVSSTY